MSKTIATRKKATPKKKAAAGNGRVKSPTVQERLQKLEQETRQVRRQIVCGMRRDGHSFEMIASPEACYPKNAMRCRWCDVIIESL